ncbi:hypothetical protein Tsubulata_030205 [Turnera subulata]|uniref:non-specific serine/threonine protein kinase n=1 Tax=Turnera subulata TaxID=218843 RepID=A0A9Q0G350_9ROSI|nr:hypothetical protein Tsubulata_030205 [Turnera subulata]
MGRIHMLVFVCMQFIFLASKCTSTPTRNNNTDQEALLALKAAITYDPQNFLTSNWTTDTSFCNWAGITCSNGSERVTELNISGMGLVGTIPPHLGNLSFLWLVDFRSNQFHGYIPPELANLRRMKYLLFSSNNFTGKYTLLKSVPEELIFQGTIPYGIFNMSSLIAIGFVYNTVYGTLPENICDNLPNLVELLLSKNQLSGRIPSGIWKCRKLQALALSYNHFEGAIPEEVGLLPMLRKLFLGVNNLTGQLPQSIFNMTSIQNIDFSYNSLSVQHLMLQYNNLTGQIPASLFNISTLLEISLDRNQLSGDLPTTIGNSRDLQVLYLQENFLSNDPSSPELDFFTSLANCRALKQLYLSDNFFSGILPQSIGNLTTNLTDVVMDNNKLVGNIPSELGNLTGLILLSLRGNNLSGAIPATVASMRNLQKLDLFSNKLSGFIPSDLCYARRLSELILRENKLSGALPDCIGRLTSLRLLVLDGNDLRSPIPLSLWGLKDLITLMMSFNSFNGSLAPQVGGMAALVQLDLAGNHFSGDIPSTLGQLKVLQSAYLWRNRFQGVIPESLGDVKGLINLDLAENNLFGIIPKSLEELELLSYFNVSFNKLEGEIPSGGSFINFTVRSFMSNKALCGPPRLQVPPCSSNDNSHRHSKATKSILLRFVLPAASATLVLVVAAFIFVLKIYQRRQIIIPSEEALPLANHRRISYLDLMRATNKLHESNLLGKGSFGSVYQGILQDGQNIAVKVFDLQLQGAFRSFDTECEILRNIRHRNLAKIICSCSNPDFKALVLQYMPNGSLEKWLYSHNYCLTIIQRLNIMLDVASALEYLHHGNPTCVVHCDLKPSNILLDDDMVAHVCDFGIGKLFGESEVTIQTKTLATVGYMAPEYGLDGVVSTKIDVYSFGILLMEIFTRRKPTDEMFDEGMSLRRWVDDSLPSSIVSIMDNNMLNTENGHPVNEENCLGSIMELALQCTHEFPEERINMIEISARLKKIRMVSLGNRRTPQR